MAPNVKQVLLLSQQLENLDIVQPKFLPLTHPAEEQKGHEAIHNQPCHEESSVYEVTPPGVCSYWDWPSEASNESDPDEDVLSASCIEERLIAEANKLRVTTEKKVADLHHGDYWDEVVEETLDGRDDNDFDRETEDRATRVPQHEVSYWDWAVDSKEVLIESIVQDEMARLQVSSEVIQKRLVVEKIGRMKEQSVRAPECAGHDSYWAWESPVVSPASLDVSHPTHCYWDWECDSDCELNGADVAKFRLIENILLEERVRNMLSIQHVEQSEQGCRVDIVSCRSISDDYWTFNAGDEESNHYWEWDTTTDSELYWAM